MLWLTPSCALQVYWYTVEFGVVREGSDVKAFGAGVLSSYGELQHMAAGKAELVGGLGPLPLLPSASASCCCYCCRFCVSAASMQR
jgi:hypothetical protein